MHKPVLKVTILFCMAQISKPIYCLYGELVVWNIFQYLYLYWKIFHFASSQYRYSALQNCIVQYSVVQYNTELPCNVHRCTTVQLSALHDKVQDKFIFNSGGVSSKQKMGIIWKIIFLNVEKFGRVETPPD